MADKHLIFGATGSIGSSLARKLKDSNQDAHLFSRNEAELKILAEDSYCRPHRTPTLRATARKYSSIARCLRDFIADASLSHIPITCPAPHHTTVLVTTTVLDDTPRVAEFFRANHTIPHTGQLPLVRHMGPCLIGHAWIFLP